MLFLQANLSKIFLAQKIAVFFAFLLSFAAGIPSYHQQCINRPIAFV